MNIQQFIQQVERTGSGSYNITGGEVNGWAREVTARTVVSQSVSESVKAFIRDYGMKLDSPHRFLTVVKNKDNIVLSLNEIIEV